MTKRADTGYSVQIKIDNISKDDGKRIVDATAAAVRQNTEGSRGTYILGSTSQLRNGAEEKPLLPAPTVKPKRSTPPRPQCRGTSTSGERCRNVPAKGNYGFCGIHR